MFFYFQEHAFRKVGKMHLSAAGSAGARQVCFEDLNKDMFWKSKVKHVVEYDVYLDILLMGSIYAITSNSLIGTHMSDQTKS